MSRCPCFDPERMIKDALGLTAAATWFALNLVLWIVIEATIELFAWSMGMGIVHFVGFFAYLGYREPRCARGE